MSTEQLIESLESISKGETEARDNDRGFAHDLLHGKYGYYNRKYLTERQEAAALKMIDRVTNPPPPPPEDTLCDLAKVYSFIKQAREHLRWPKLILRMDEEHDLKVYLSGDRSRQPNTVNLVTNDEYGNMDLWLGRVFEDGRWQHRKGNDELREKAGTLLQQLAQDPAAVAAHHGHLTGSCCFCNRKLTDERSTDVGYGPVCAKKWNVPWGTK